MILLGFDTSTSATAVALRLADGATREARDDPAPGQRPGHATRLLPLAERLLAEAGLSWGAVERIGAGVGPGAFTGLRVGLATARGLAHSLAAELTGVCSLHALALPALQEGRPESVLAALDARRGEVFAAGWGHGGELLAPRALAPQRLAEQLEARGPWWAIGDGALRFRDAFEALDVEVPPADSPRHRVAAASICELALAAAPRPPEQLLPAYLRRPDAEIALQGAPV